MPFCIWSLLQRPRRSTPFLHHRLNDLRALMRLTGVRFGVRVNDEYHRAFGNEPADDKKALRKRIKALEANATSIRKDALEEELRLGERKEAARGELAKARSAINADVDAACEQLPAQQCRRLRARFSQ